MLNTTCPQCSSPFGRKLSLIHKEGLTFMKSNSNSTSHTNTILKTKITTKGSSTAFHQTELSKSVAPPLVFHGVFVSESSALAGALGFIGATVGFFLGFFLGSDFLSRIGIASAFGIFLFFTIRSLINKDPTTQEIEAYEAKISSSKKALEDWNNTYMCMACGNRFIPEKILEDETVAQNQ